ncbi:MAG: single-stranded DNA-binding protein [Bacilli bacterium]|nr:single-stranded DNA-binding protein [Bacilli bacterium]MBQ6404648.1 single-stranded DNA-binding protein [Bacilli bacterium]
MNKVFLIGRLTRDPELRYTGNNTPVATFSLAVNRNFSNQQGEREADFINIVVWRKQAENVKNYLSQGSQVAIDGRIQTRSYDDKDGQKRYVTEVVADNVEFLGSKNSSNNSSNGSHNEEPTPYDFGDEKEPKGTDVDSNPFADFGSSIEISDDELPF